MVSEKELLYDTLCCPFCKSSFQKVAGKLICKSKHVFEINSGVPLLAKLNSYLRTESEAWEDEWEKGVSGKALASYKKNMKVFKKLGYWEESGEALRFLPMDYSTSVLDLGCGNGVSTANIKADFVVGAELSQKQMVRAKSRFPTKNFIVADASYLPFKNETFDMVIAINLLHHISTNQKVLREAFRVLKKGGKLLTVDPNLYNPIGFIGRGLYRLFGLKKVFPTFPQFALGAKERQFTKGQYYRMFKKSPFKIYKITPHRIERLLFFVTILFPRLSTFPLYDQLLITTSRVGNTIVKLPLLDNLCYFWMGEATKL